MKKYFEFLPISLILIFAFIVYWFTKPPSILWIDSGTMIAAASSLGIPNPPGFPLYMMVGNLFTKLPFATDLASLEFMSIFFSMLLLFLIYSIIKTLIENDFFFDKPSTNYPLITNHYALSTNLPAAFGTIALAFSYQYWSQSQNTESFIFTYSFVALFAYMLIKLNIAKKNLPEEKTDIKNYSNKTFKTLAAIAFLFGLGAGANPTIAAMVLPVLYTMFLNRKFLNIQKLIVLGLTFLLTISAVYSYLPLRASTWPFVNWGNPQTPELFLGHLHGAGLNIYEPQSNSVNGFTGSPLVLFQSLIYYFLNTFVQFTPILWPFIAGGIYFLYKKNKRLLTFLILVPAFNALYSGIYYSGNQESWFILSWMFFAIFIGIGFYYLVNLSIVHPDKGRVKGQLSNVKLLALFSLCAVPLLAFFILLNRSSHYYARDYIENLYAPLEQNAILIGTGDFFDALSHYTHVADKFREDVTPVTANVFYVNKWNRDALRHSTDLVISDNLESKIKYETLTEYNDVMNQFIDENIGKRPIYVTHLTLRASALAGTDAGQLNLDPNRFKFVPHGLSLKVVRTQSNEIPKLSAFDFKMTKPITKGPVYFEKNYRGAFTNILNDYSYAYEYLADWYSEAEEDKNAQHYYNKALEITPNAEVYAHLGEYWAKRENYDLSAQYLEKAQRLDIKNPTVHFNLGLSYANLGKVAQAKQQFEAVKTLVGNPEIGLFKDADNAQKQLSTFDLNDPELASQTQDWQRLEDRQNNISLKIPEGFSKVSTSDYGSIVVSDNQPGNLGLNIEMLGTRLAKDDNPDDIIKKSPIPMLGQLLDLQTVKFLGHTAAVQIYATKTGESQQRYLLMKNDWLWQFKVYPGGSSKLDLFTKILSTFEPYSE